MQSHLTISHLRYAKIRQGWGKLISKAKKGVKKHTRALIVARRKYGENFTNMQLEHIKSKLSVYPLTAEDVMHEYDCGRQVFTPGSKID